MLSGLVIGKFMPPHLGHRYLIDFARGMVSDLTVQVCSTRTEVIPGALRYDWMQRAFGGVTVLHNDDENPAEPEQCPDRFWDIWRTSLLSRMDRPPDVLFASEPYGILLAQSLGARFVPVDINRALVPISATAIRSEPLRFWDWLLPEARPYFLKRVAIVGPESSGKSTLAAALAAHYQTHYVAEYGRTYLDALGGPVTQKAIEAILSGHRASESALALQANRILFSDTEAIITACWAEIFLGSIPDFVAEAMDASQYDLYLLMRATSEWVEDPQRCQPSWKDRHTFELRIRSLMDAHARPYVVLEGSWENRHAFALAAVDSVLGK